MSCARWRGRCLDALDDSSGFSFCWRRHGAGSVVRAADPIVPEAGRPSFGPLLSEELGGARLGVAHLDQSRDPFDLATPAIGAHRGRGEGEAEHRWSVADELLDGAARQFPRALASDLASIGKPDRPARRIELDDHLRDARVVGRQDQPLATTPFDEREGRGDARLLALPQVMLGSYASLHRCERRRGRDRARGHGGSRWKHRRPAPANDSRDAIRRDGRNDHR